MDKIREDTTWNKVKDITKNKALPMTLDVINTVATGVITATLKSLF